MTDTRPAGSYPANRFKSTELLNKRRKGVISDGSFVREGWINRLNFSALVFQTGGPIHHHGQRRRGSRARTASCCDQETLAVGSDGIVESVICRHHVRSKQRHGNARLKQRLRARNYFYHHGHHLSVGSFKEKLFDVAAPAGLFAASNGDGPFSIGWREGADVDFIPAGTIRGKSHPVT